MMSSVSRTDAKPLRRATRRRTAYGAALSGLFLVSALAGSSAPTGFPQAPAAGFSVAHGAVGGRILIRGGVVVDGSGRAGWRADVEVADGKIVAVGRLRARSGETI